MMNVFLGPDRIVSFSAGCRLAAGALLIVMGAACGSSSPETSTSSSAASSGSTGSGGQGGASSTSGGDQGGAGQGGSSSQGGGGSGSGSVLTTGCWMGDTVDCTALAGAYASGQATCRASGNGYDVTACVLKHIDNAKRVHELVYPAQRDPQHWKDATCSQSGDFIFDISFPADISMKDVHTWQLELQGGGFCFSNGTDKFANGAEDCPVRPIALVASTDAQGNPLPADRTFLKDSPANPGFEQGAVLVHAVYCSNDFWAGTRTRDQGVPIPYPKNNGPVTPWSFAGRINVKSMLATLIERYGLDDADKSLFIHARGTSAGGWGTINNAWLYAAVFPGAAAEQRLRISDWSAFIPFKWDEPGFPPLHLQGVSGQEIFTQAQSTWSAELTPACVAKNPAFPAGCMSADALYELITGPAPGGMGLPMLVFQNIQDQLYMDRFASLPIVAGATQAELDARAKWVTMINGALGVDPSKPNKSSRIQWLYAVSDPKTAAADTNVHPPTDYEFDSPIGPSASVQAMTQDFLATPMKPPQVRTFDCDWVLSGGQHGACP